jgi:hypothetical protein
MHPQIVQELNNQIASLEAMSDAVERTETAARLTLAASVMRKAIHVLTAPVLSDDDVPFFLRKQAE